MRSSLSTAVCFLALIGCHGDSPSSPPTADRVHLPEADMERLQSLGYEPWVEEPEVDQETGVTRIDPSRSTPGFVVFANRGGCSAVLMDKNDRVYHTWQGDVRGFWSDSELLADGHLLVVGAKSNDANREPVDRYLRKLAWDSSIVWESEFPAHHDVEALADGRLLTLSSSIREVDEDGSTRTIIDDEVVITSPQGRIEERYSLYDLFRASPEIATLRFQRRKIYVGDRQAADIFHANSVDWIPDSPLAHTNALYKPGNVLVSMRHQDVVVIFDREQRRLVWAWGRGELDGQHSARLLANGNVTIFDNGMRRQHSRVVEVDPRTGRITWEFSGPEPSDFFSPGGGSAQRLPTGNTLITETRKGLLFEVTAGGEIVWMFINPRTDPQQPRRATIHSSKWRSAGEILPILEGKPPPGKGAASITPTSGPETSRGGRTR